MPILSVDDSLVEAGDLVDFPGAPFNEMQVFAVGEAIRSECGWHIAPEITELVTVDGSGSRMQPLPTLHLVDVLEVLEDTEPVTVDGTTVQWSESGYLWRHSPWTSRLRGVQSRIVHGYDGCPAGLAAVVAAMCRTLQNDPSIASERAGALSVTYRELTDALDPTERLAATSMVAKYKITTGP